jgi:hypothetical protein
MLEGIADLTLDQLNEATLAWIEMEYNRSVHSELGEAPLQRYLHHRDVGRYEAHLFGRTAKGFGIGVGQKCGRKHDPRSAIVALGELSPEVAGCSGFGDQQENGFEDRGRVD